MQHPERWKAHRCLRDAQGRFTGPYMERIIGRAYLPAIQAHARGALVDLGCGEVPYYGWYRDQVTSTTCVDWPNSLHGNTHVDHQADLNGPLPFLPNSSFDTVLCTDVLEHLHSPDHLMAEMLRILRPGGHLIIGVPFLYWIHEAPHDHHRYTEHQLRHWCAQHHLQPVVLQAYGGWPEVVFDTVYKGIHLLRLPGRGLLLGLWLGLGTVLAKLPAVRRMSVRSRAQFPLGYVLVARK